MSWVNLMWWCNDNTEFERFKSEISDFDFFNYWIENDRVIIEGCWPVYGKTSHIRNYKIRIVMPDDFPNTPPTVFEVGEEIPKSPEYHFNISDNSACLFARPERFKVWPPGAGIKDFINGPVRAFFFSQAFKGLTGKWPFGEWSHGNDGIVEFYAHSLDVTSLIVIKEMLELALEHKIFRQWKCPCGSGKRVISCHEEKISTLSKILPYFEIFDALKIIDHEIMQGKKTVKLIKKN